MKQHACLASRVGRLQLCGFGFIGFRQHQQVGPRKFVSAPRQLATLLGLGAKIIGVAHAIESPEGQTGSRPALLFRPGLQPT